MEDGTGLTRHQHGEDRPLLWAEAPEVATLDEPYPPPPPAGAAKRDTVPSPPGPTSPGPTSPGPTPPGPTPPGPTLPPGPDRLDEGTVVRPRETRPESGWRAVVHRLTGGLVSPRPSRVELAWEALLARCQAPCDAGRRIAVISRKGGVGKTTTTLMIGHTLAALRRDRVVALDGNPDAGTLAHRIVRQTEATVIDALTRAGSLGGYPQARALTSQAPSRLEVLASPQDPHASRALRGEDYRRVIDAIDLHYNVVLVDTGTGITDDANLGILDAVDQIVLVSGTALDSARAASLTLDWLQANGRADLVADAVVVVNAVGSMGRVDLDQVVRHFAGRCRAVHQIPFDRHLEAGATTDPDALAPSTQRAWLEVAASVVDGFTIPSRRVRPPRRSTPAPGTAGT